MVMDEANVVSQFIIATHSPIIMAYPDACMYVLSKDGIRIVPYEETEHYLLTRGFLVNPHRTLSDLLSNDGPAEQGPRAESKDDGM
jgi:predicted ATPase